MQTRERIFISSSFHVLDIHFQHLRAFNWWVWVCGSLFIIYLAMNNFHIKIYSNTFLSLQICVYSSLFSSFHFPDSFLVTFSLNLIFVAWRYRARSWHFFFIILQLGLSCVFWFLFINALFWLLSLYVVYPMLLTGNS